MAKRVKSPGRHTAEYLASDEAAQATKNRAFYNQMLLAQNNVYIAKFGTEGKQNVKAFWAATKSLWQGRPVNQRIQAVLDGLGVSDLEEAYDYVFDVNTREKAELRAMIERGDETGWTDTQVDYAESVAETDGTPIFASVINPKHTPEGTRIKQTPDSVRGAHERGAHEYDGKHVQRPVPTQGYTPKHTAPKGKHER